MSQEDYSVIISPLLSNKLDEIAYTISSKLEEYEQKLESIIHKLDTIENKLITCEQNINSIYLENYNDYWKKSS